MMPAILPLEIPAPAALKALREEIGLSIDGLAYELGFTKNGADIVRAWERGTRNGQPCKPTPLAWRCFRLLVVASRCVGMDVTAAAAYLRAHLPEGVQ